MPEIDEKDLGKTKPPFDFREERNAVFYHNIKIFIFGADVTPWLTSAVTMSRADRNGIGSLSFELSNVNRAFEITEQNIGANLSDVQLKELNNLYIRTNSSGRTKPVRNFRLTDPYAADGMYSELAKAVIFKLKEDSPTNLKHGTKSFGPVKGAGFGGRLSDKDVTNFASNTKDSTTSRYPMNIGSLVFHKYDPIRFFVKNPLSRSDEEWVCEFTGYVDTKPFSQDYVNGQSVIRVTCQDARVLLQNMRVNTNPAAQTGNENVLFFGNGPGDKVVKDTAEAGIFNDFFISGNRLGHSLLGQTFVDSIKFLLLGYNRNGSYSGRIGKFTEGVTMRYNPESEKRKSVLEKWNNLIQFGSFPLPVASDAAPTSTENATRSPTSTAPPSKETDLVPLSAAAKANTLGRTPERYLTKIEMLKLGQNTYNGGSASPEVGRVHFLLPSSGSPLTNLIEGPIVDTRVTARVEWATRLELITNMCKSIDYQFYVTGIGDIVFEFPQYDFMPYDYNDKYSSLYTFTNHLQSDSVNDEGGTPISALEVTSRTLRTELAGAVGLNGAGAEVGLDVDLRRTIFSNVMASRVGVHVETHSIPGITGDGAQRRLAQYGMIEFNKRLANYNKFDINATYRPYMGVNRPIYHTRKSRMAITENITYTWRIRQDVTLEMSMNYTRRLEGDKFRFITGGERMPISYNTIFDNASQIFNKGNGLNISPENSGDVPAFEVQVPDTQSLEANAGLA